MNEEQASRLQARSTRGGPGRWATAEELDFEHSPASNGYPGIPVKAWIRFLNCAELVDGQVYAWTSRAVEVTWTGR